MSESEKIKDLVVAALEDIKAVDIKVVDVRGKSGITDFMVIASGNSDRHLKALSDNIVEKAKKDGHPPLGVEGEQAGEWVLVDLVDVVVHIMLPRARDFYQLEKLWAPGVDRVVAG